MDTQIITNPSDQELDMLARALRNGELVSIPTETVYGLGANGLDPEAMDKIIKINADSLLTMPDIGSGMESYRNFIGISKISARKTIF